MHYFCISDLRESYTWLFPGTMISLGGDKYWNFSIANQFQAAPSRAWSILQLKRISKVLPSALPGWPVGKPGTPREHPSVPAAAGGAWAPACSSASGRPACRRRSPRPPSRSGLQAEGQACDRPAPPHPQCPSPGSPQVFQGHCRTPPKQVSAAFTPHQGFRAPNSSLSSCLPTILKAPEDKGCGCLGHHRVPNTAQHRARFRAGIHHCFLMEGGRFMSTL